MTAGYSGTPLVKKLGIKEGARVGLVHAPEGFVSDTLGPLPLAAHVLEAKRARELDLILLFVRREIDLTRGIPAMMQRMTPESVLWICWAKKSSPLATEVDEGVVRSTGLASGLVDVKIAAIDPDWSGLKFVYRLKDRPKLRKK